MRSPGRANSREGGYGGAHAGAGMIVRQLTAMLAARDERNAAGCDQTSRTACVISTGWDAIDRALAPASPRAIDSDALAHIGHGGLQRSIIHEWLGQEESAILRRRWLPPHTLFIHLAWRAIETDADSSGLIIWIGRRVWPQANVLRRGTEEFTTEARRQGERMWIGECVNRNFSCIRKLGLSLKRISNLKSQIHSAFSLPPCLRGEFPSPHISNVMLSRSLFIDPPDDASRLWAIDLALRSPAASVVIADGSKLKMAESRRLQLAAERGRALALLARPAWEASELSAAAMRWRVHRIPSPSLAPRWIVELLRCKHGCAVQSSRKSSLIAGFSCGGKGGWEMEYASTGHVRLVADVVDRSDSPREAEGDRKYARSLA